MSLTPPKSHLFTITCLCEFQVWFVLEPPKINLSFNNQMRMVLFVDTLESSQSYLGQMI